jgi:hypothetical protein
LEKVDELKKYLLLIWKRSTVLYSLTNPKDLKHKKGEIICLRFVFFYNYPKALDKAKQQYPLLLPEVIRKWSFVSLFSFPVNSFYTMVWVIVKV